MSGDRQPRPGDRVRVSFEPWNWPPQPSKGPFTEVVS